MTETAFLDDRAQPPYRTASALADRNGVVHGFFGRQGGVSQGLYASLNCGPGSGDDPGRVAENRARVARTLGLAPDRLVTLYQIHSAKAVTVETPWARQDAPQADGMATSEPGLALGILTADCCPVLFADASARVIGAAHAGWQGALSGVLEATLETMTALGADRSAVTAVLGPTISQANYEVGPEFKERFLAHDPGTERFFAPSGKAAHWRFDLPGFVAVRLVQAGVGRIEDTGLCTYADEDAFFSYRRTTHRKEPDYGRDLSIVALTDG